MSRTWTALLLMAFLAAGAGGEEQTGVTFTETDQLLPNPGVGWQTFHRSAGEDASLAGLPSTVFYARYYWADIEKGDGEYDWSIIDKDIARAAASSQTLALRVMTTGTERRGVFSPAYLKDLGCLIRVFEYERRGRYETPDFNDPVFLEKHLRFIKVFGERYNGRRDVCLVDIGSIGLWGEWHMSGTEVPMPSEENAVRIIDAYAEAFPDTPLVMQLDYVPGMRRAKEIGMGWRVDCWGDMGGFSKTWCHMRILYPKSIEEAGVAEVWKTAPVALETCWDIRRWHREGWDIDYILKWALDQHASFINNKSAPIPEELFDKVNKWLAKVGYRFVLRGASYDGALQAGGRLRLDCRWENVGCAPAYSEFHPWISLADKDGGIVWQHEVSDFTFRGKLPGAFESRIECDLTGEPPVSKGEYDLLLSVGTNADPTAVRLAIEGRRDDGRYLIGRVTVR